MQWEYLIVTETVDSSELSRLGAEGWELVAVVSPGHFVMHHFFKRQVNT